MTGELSDQLEAMRAQLRDVESQRDELLQQTAAQAEQIEALNEGTSRALDGGGDKQSPSDLAAQLNKQIECLRDVEPGDSCVTAEKVARILGVFIRLLKKLDQTIDSQLEVLGKNHPRIKAMGQTLQSQGLLNVESALAAVMSSDSEKITRLSNYADLLLRWWSAVLAGVQTTVLEVPNEITEALNPANWELEKKRWASEEAAYWEHFKFVIRQEVPLRTGDKIKNIQAEKTLEAYAAIGGGQISASEGR